jgi:hypothetical protein
MTYDEWNQNSTNAVELNKLIRTPIFERAVSVLEQISPTKEMNAKQLPDLLAAQASTLYLGQIQGYEKYLTNLKKLCEGAPEIPPQPQETYGAEQEPVQPLPRTRKKK